jgi:hypothetical protein
MRRIYLLNVALCGLAAAGNCADATTYQQFNVEDKVAVIERVSLPKPPLWARDVSQSRHEWGKAGVQGKPVFEAVIPFVVPPAKDSGEPFYKHNHCPSIAWLPNGDLLACWFSTEGEAGTEMTILASRKRAGAREWDPASEFFKARNRNMTGSSLFHDGAGTLFHFNGIGREGIPGWDRLVLMLRTSRDNGVTWTTPRAISRDGVYTTRNQAISGTVMTRGGILIQPCDATPWGEGPSALHISRDQGLTWVDAGGDIRGIHAGVAELTDGRLMAFGRAQALDDHMPISLSRDLGKTWTYKASPFNPIGSGQRLVFMRLAEGPLLLVSFTDAFWKVEKAQRKGLAFTRADGRSFIGHGLFAALSFDEGETWPVRKLLTPGDGSYGGGAWTGTFTTTADTAEPGGYLAATQTPDGVIQLISSRLHYRFNSIWLKTPGE